VNNGFEKAVEGKGGHGVWMEVVRKTKKDRRIAGVHTET
jgi:hypothetical protein